jgi:hypothetical protein
MRDTAAALAWLVDLLRSRSIPFQAVGGLAARAYGATRSLNDIDIFMPMRRIGEVEPDLTPFLTRPPLPHRDDSWNLTFAQLVYAEQKIEIAGVEGARYRDRASGAWVPQHIDFTRSHWVQLYGVSVPVMPREDLIEYKQRLNREVDRLDLAQIAGNSAP